MSGYDRFFVFICGPIYDASLENSIFPGNAVHEKGLQTQKGVGSLVGSQERKALLVPRLDQLFTARQPVAVFIHWFT